MSPTRKGPIKHKVYKCARCPQGRAYDIVAIPASGKNPKRSLQQHVIDAHPDFQGDFRDLVGETITRFRGQGQQPTTGAVDAGDAIPTPGSTSNAETSFAQSILRPVPKSDVEYQESANHARTKVTAIYELLDNDKADEVVTIGMDQWDSAARDGKVDEEMNNLAKLAFPGDLFHDQYTVCSISDEIVLLHLANYYSEKATRFEDETA